MDGRLWTILYREIQRASKPKVGPRRAGRPVVYRTDEVLAVWVFAALMDWPISVTHERLTSGAAGWWLRRHWQWPLRVPSVPTLTRRAKQPAFRRLLRCLLERLRKRMAVAPTGDVVMDSTFLCTGWYSRDPDSRRSCHGGKWYRGYALHVICDERGVVWAWHVTSANVQEMAVARRLIRQMSLVGCGACYVVADTGYDSEPLHQRVRIHLGGQLLAPINSRGGKSERWRVRQPGRDAADRFLSTQEGRAVFEKRSVIERLNSWFKGTSNVSMLPYHVRRLGRVRRWIDLKLAVFFVRQQLVHQGLATVA